MSEPTRYYVVNMEEVPRVLCEAISFRLLCDATEYMLAVVHQTGAIHKILKEVREGTPSVYVDNLGDVDEAEEGVEEE